MWLQFFGKTFFVVVCFPVYPMSSRTPSQTEQISLHSSFEKWESIKNSIHHLFKWLNKLNATLKTNRFNEFEFWRSHATTLFNATLKMNVNEWSHFKLYDYLFHSFEISIDSIFHWNNRNWLFDAHYTKRYAFTNSLEKLMNAKENKWIMDVECGDSVQLNKHDKLTLILFENVINKNRRIVWLNLKRTRHFVETFRFDKWHIIWFIWHKYHDK